MIRVMVSKGKDWECRLVIVCLTNAVPMSGFHGEYLIPRGPYIMYVSFMSMLYAVTYHKITIWQ